MYVDIDSTTSAESMIEHCTLANCMLARRRHVHFPVACVLCCVATQNYIVATMARIVSCVYFAYVNQRRRIRVPQGACLR